MYIGWCSECSIEWGVSREKAQDKKKVKCSQCNTQLFVYVPTFWSNDDPRPSCNKGLEVPYDHRLWKGKDVHGVFQWEEGKDAEKAPV